MPIYDAIVVGPDLIGSAAACNLAKNEAQHAKSADELGHIAASFLADGRFPPPYNPEEFNLVYAQPVRI